MSGKLQGVSLSYGNNSFFYRTLPGINTENQKYFDYFAAGLSLVDIMRLLLGSFSFVFSIVIAFVLAIPLFMLLPEKISQKFAVRLIEHQVRADGTCRFYIDLNNNGYSEMVLCGQNNPWSVFINVAVHDGIVGQWNFPGSFPAGNTKFLTGDYDQNSFLEFYVFILQHDSLWLHSFEPLNPDNTETLKKFIDVIKPRDGIIEVYIKKGGLHDMNGDGYNDLVFGVEASFSAYPRRIVLFDIYNDTLHRSDVMGAGVNRILFDDLNRDGNPNLILHTLSHCNTIPGTTPFHDHSCWLMVMNHQLDFIFEPVELKGEFGMFTVYPVRANDETNLVALHHVFGEKNPNSALYVFDIQGNEILREDLINYDSRRSALLFTPDHTDNNELLVVSHTDERIYNINRNLQIERILAEYKTGFHPFYLDLNNNGAEEIILIERNARVMRIYQANFAHPVDVELFEPSDGSPQISVKYSGDEHPEFAVQIGKNFALFLFDSNPAYHLRLPLYILSYSVVLSLIILIQYLARKRVQKRIAIERQLSTLQINNLLNQLDPHFTFNSLNSIGHSILKEEKEVAYNYLIKFSQLIRSGLSDSEVVSRSIEKELQIVRNYLDLQKHSQENNFHYKIDIQDSVNLRWEIPKMILMTHVENALKHGLPSVKDNGLIRIEITTWSDYIKLVIEDNGIGRKQAAVKNGDSTRKGLQLIEGFIGFFNRFNTGKISQEIIDLFHPDGKPCGTRVVILIPAQYNYSFSSQ